MRDVNAPELVQLRLAGESREEFHPLSTAPRFPKLRQITVLNYPSLPTGADRFGAFFEAHPHLQDVVLETARPTLTTTEGEAALIFGRHLPNLKKLRLLPSRQDGLTAEQVSEIRDILQLRSSRVPRAQAFEMVLGPECHALRHQSPDLIASYNGPVLLNLLPFPNEPGVLECSGPFGVGISYRVGLHYSVWDKC